MVRITVVGCTGKLGGIIMQNVLKRKDVKNDVQLNYAIARQGNHFVGKNISELVGGNFDLKIIDDLTLAADSDVYIDCTNTDAFINNNYSKYEKMKKPLVIATTGFASDSIEKINRLSTHMPIFMTGNFSIALHDFIETLKFMAKRISADTDIQIIEYHHNQKMDAPSGTALMIKDTLTKTNDRIIPETINICSVRGGNIFGQHEVIFATDKDEVLTFKHQVASRESFADGAIEAACWIVNQPNGLHNMDDLCGDIT